MRGMAAKIGRILGTHASVLVENRATVYIYIMSSAEKKTRVTEEEYFAYEESIEGLAEYYNGEIFDMAGGSQNHARIGSNLNRQIGNRLDGKGCEVYGGDFRLQIEAARTFVRPDIWVICGKADLMPNRNDTAKNPILVAEVQSKSTTVFDHRGKFELYLKLPSLIEYVIVEQDTAMVDVFFRNSQGILEFTRVTDLEEEVYFRSLGFGVPMKEIYQNVDFEVVE